MFFKGFCVGYFVPCASLIKSTLLNFYLDGSLPQYGTTVRLAAIFVSLLERNSVQMLFWYIQTFSQKMTRMKMKVNTTAIILNSDIEGPVYFHTQPLNSHPDSLWLR